MQFCLNQLVPAVLLTLASPALCFSDTLQITSTPPGATVEINSVSVGVTPYEEEVPGGYFHKTKTALGRRLEHSMVARISLAGYATKEIQNDRRAHDMGLPKGPQPR